MNHRFVTRLLSLTAAFAACLASVGSARADLCQTAEASIENVVITVNPATDCLELSVEGDLSGCAEPTFHINNLCADDLTFNDDDPTLCGPCAPIPAGSATDLEISYVQLVGEDTHKTIVYSANMGDTPIEITIELDAIPTNSGNPSEGSACSVGAPGSGDLGLKSGALTLVGIAVGFVLRRRRSRAGQTPPKSAV
ncbi:MAG: hypothetical protein IPK82_29085 [Polyangiaceae bacterium]|nr:hypothetical protein [Polyangiaceae bacterium]